MRYRPLAVVEEQVRELAVRRYTEAYRKLSTNAPEFGVWARMVESQATRALLRHAVTDLSERLRELRSLSAPRPSTRPWPDSASGIGRAWTARSSPPPSPPRTSCCPPWARATSTRT